MSGDVESSHKNKRKESQVAEQWGLIVTLIDGKSPNIVDTTLKFSTQKLASRAALKITDAVREKNIRNLQIIGPFQLTEE